MKNVTKVVADKAAATRQASATVASERLATVIKSIGSRSSAYIVKTYGADIDLAAIKLAKRTADELATGNKSRGGNRNIVLAVLSIIETTEELTDAVFVAAARSALDADTKQRNGRKEDERGYADSANDLTLSASARRAAFEVLTGMQAEDIKAKQIKARKAFAASIKRAIAVGVTEDEALEAVTGAYAELTTSAN